LVESPTIQEEMLDEDAEMLAEDVEESIFAAQEPVDAADIARIEQLFESGIRKSLIG
jgi:hypothetical protein